MKRKEIVKLIREIKLTDKERKEVLIARKKEYIRQYKFLLERHLKDDNNYKLNHALIANLNYFVQDIENTDKLLEAYDIKETQEYKEFSRANFTMDDIPF